MSSELIDGIMLGILILVFIRVFLCDSYILDEIWYKVDEWCQRKGLLK
jgi:hypothetical protein